MVWRNELHSGIGINERDRAVYSDRAGGFYVP